MNSDESGVERPDVRAVLAAATRTLHEEMTSQEMLQAIVDAASISIPGFERASVSVLGRRKPELATKAATDDLVRKLDLLQYELEQGPCMDAMSGPSLVEAPRLRHEQRWPRYVQAAVEHGITAQLAVKLDLDNEAATVGGLNLYSTSTEEVSDEARAMAELFATQAAVALGCNRRRISLNDGLVSRQLVGQAIGLLMERYGLDEHRAFQFLVRTSTTGNIKLRQVAQSLVDDANHRPPPADSAEPAQLAQPAGSAPGSAAPTETSR